MQHNRILKKVDFLLTYLCDPCGGAFFGPMGIILNLVDFHYIYKGGATYQILSIYALRFTQEDFFMFPFISQCKICDPRVGLFNPMSIILTNLVEVH